MKTDLSGKIAVVTGAGGVLCSRFAVALAQSGAKVALLNRTLAKAEKIEEEIKALGGEAISVQVDVTSKESCEKAHEEVVARLGKCDILINGAGGNNPIATADEEFFSEETMEDPAKKSFFDLDQTGFTSVFGLNIVGVLLPTQVFARDLAEKKNGVIINVSSMNAYRPLTKIPILCGQSGSFQFHTVAGSLLRAGMNPLQRHSSGLLLDSPEQGAALE